MNNSSKYTYTTTQFNDKENHQKCKYFYHEKKRYIFFCHTISVVGKFLSRCQTFRARNFTCAPALACK